MGREAGEVLCMLPCSAPQGGRCGIESCTSPAVTHGGVLPWGGHKRELAVSLKQYNFRVARRLMCLFVSVHFVRSAAVEGLAISLRVCLLVY